MTSFLLGSPVLRGLRTAGLFAVLSAACSLDVGEAELALPMTCQPLYGPMECRAPFPSDFFRVADSTTQTGFHLELRGTSDLRTPAKDREASIYTHMKIDGASIVPTIVAALPGVVVSDGLPKVLDTPDKSTRKESPTLLIEADTGALVPHYTDIIGDAGDKLSAPIVLRPMVALKPQTRYVVAFTGIQKDGGGLAPPGEGFRKLREDTSTEKALLRIRGHYENDIFPITTKAGVDRKSLQLAWDFTTGSVDSVRHDTLAVREKTLAWLETNTPKIAITAVEPSDDPKVWKYVRGTIEGPNYLEKPTK